MWRLRNSSGRSVRSSGCQWSARQHTKFGAFSKRRPLKTKWPFRRGHQIPYICASYLYQQRTMLNRTSREHTKQPMRALLLPIKNLRNAKQRLAGFLKPQERFGLAQAMLTDTVRAVRGVRQAEKIFVVTNYGPAIAIAEANGWEVFLEEQQISESVSVDAASQQCWERGVTSVLRLPLDLPLLESRDIDELLELECPAPGLVIVASRDGTGTNAILRTPPT